MDFNCEDVTFVRPNWNFISQYKTYTMKKHVLIFALLVLFGGFVIGQETLTWRFAKPQIISGTPDLFQFDVEVKANVSGTYHRDLQVYFDYNTAAFGTDIVTNGKVTVSALALMDPTKYFVVNTADNTSSKFAVITEATNEMSQNGSGTFFTEVPTTFAGFLRFQIEISNTTELAGIVFDQTLMNGGQYKQDLTSTDPIKYSDPSLYDNDLSASPLDGLHFSSIKCFVEGPYDAGTGSVMFTDLTTYLPLAQPYNPTLPYYGNGAPVWLYGGSESVVSFPVNTVDWILVQLRDADQPINAGSVTSVGTKPAFLLSNGDIVGIDGNPFNIKLNTAYTDNLYMVIFHRNHLGIISSNEMGINAVGEYVGYDFSSAETQVYGGASGHKDLGAGVWGMIAADGDADGFVLPSDETSVWLNDVNATGYLGGDFNLNGIGQPDDETSYWLPNANKAGQIPGAKGVANGYQSQVPK